MPFAAMRLRAAVAPGGGGPGGGASIFAFGETAGSAIRYSIGPGTWGSAQTPSGFGTALPRVLALSGGRLLIAAGSGVRYADDDAANWALVTPGITFGNGMAASGSTVIAGLSGNGIGLSTDAGPTWSTVGPSIPFTHFGIRPGLAVALANTSQPSYSTDGGPTWSALGGRLDSTAESFNPFSQGVANGSTIMFGGNRWAGPLGVSNFVPGIARTTDGISFFMPVVSLVPADGTVSVLIAGEPDEWVAATTSGAIFYTVNNGTNWTRATSTLGVAAATGAYSGGTFTLGGGNAGAGVIKESTDKDNWTTATQPLTHSVSTLVTKVA